MTSGKGSSPAACNPAITASLLNGKKLPAKNAAKSIPQYPHLTNSPMMNPTDNLFLLFLKSSFSSSFLYCISEVSGMNMLYSMINMVTSRRQINVMLVAFPFVNVMK